MKDLVLRKLTLALAALVLFTAVSAADGPGDKKAKVKLPQPVQVTPAIPTPTPGTVGKLFANQWYVFESDEQLLVLSSPAGLVTVTEDVGPLKIKGRFFDGGSENETRIYKGKFIYVVEAARDGRTELLIVPSGANKAEDVIRQSLDVIAGKAPIPPPGPGPKPVPPGPDVDPNAPPPIAGEGFRVLIVYETGQNLPAAQSPILFGKTIREYLDAKTVLDADGRTHAWRIWDKDVDASGESKSWQDALARPRKSIPWILISNGTTGYEGPLPATVDEALALLKKYGG